PDPAVRDGDVGFEPLAREHGKHAAAAKHDVRGLVSAGHGQAPGEIVHGVTIMALAMQVLSPRSLEEALRLIAEYPGAVPIEGGTDVMVDINFDRRRPDALLNLNEVAELKGWRRENGTLRLGASLTYTEAMAPELAD